MNIRTIAGLVLVLGSPPALAAEIPELRSDEGIRTVHDLVFTVENLAGTVEDLQVKETDTEIRLELAADVLFGFDEADIRPEADETLAKAAEVLRERGKGTVRIAGHTDAKGSPAYNQKLSERRAQAVKNWFTRKGKVTGVRFQTEGMGARQPIAPNENPDGTDDPEGRRQNRRVEIVIQKG